MPTKRKQSDEFGTFEADTSEEIALTEVKDSCESGSITEELKVEAPQVSPIIKALAKPKAEVKIVEPVAEPAVESNITSTKPQALVATIKPKPLRPRNLPRFSALK